MVALLKVVSQISKNGNSKDEKFQSCPFGVLSVPGSELDGLMVPMRGERERREREREREGGR